MDKERYEEIVSALKNRKEHCDGELTCTGCVFEDVCMEYGMIPCDWTIERMILK